MDEKDYLDYTTLRILNQLYTTNTGYTALSRMVTSNTILSNRLRKLQTAGYITHVAQRGTRGYHSVYTLTESGQRLVKQLAISDFIKKVENLVSAKITPLSQPVSM